MLRPAVAGLAVLLATTLSWGCAPASSDAGTADASVAIPGPGEPGGGSIGAPGDAGARFARAFDGGVGAATTGLACGPLRCPKGAHATGGGPTCCIGALVERFQVGAIDDAGAGGAPGVIYAYACAASASECEPDSVAELACAAASDCAGGKRCCAARAGDGGAATPLVSRCAATCDAQETELCDPRLLFSSCANWCDASRAHALGLPDGYGACAVVRP